MSLAIIKILAERVATSLEQLRQEARYRELTEQLQLVLGPQAVEGLEGVMRGIARADLELISIHAGQLINDVTPRLSSMPPTTPEEES